MKRLFSSSVPWSQRADFFLLALAVIGVLFHVLGESTRRLRPEPYLREKMSAATRTVRCFEVVREHRLGAPTAVDLVNDPEGSGLIGEEFTLTTTDRGILDSKLTSVNPNFAALFVEYFKGLGLEAGDPIAIAMTGSFPALNIAALVAAEELSLLPLPITSVGASMWGANDPNFTWLDMESLLNERGLLHTRSVAASLGGSNDRGRGLSPKGRALLEEAITRNGIPLIAKPTLDESIDERIAIFDREAEPRGIRAYVNIGGSSASIGTSLDGGLIRPGPNLKLPDYNWTQRGALQHYAKRRVPVVHLLRIQTIAREHGFPVAPETVPPVGEGKIFHQEVYDLKVVLPSLLIYLALCFGLLRSRKKAAQAAQGGLTGVPVGLVPSDSGPSSHTLLSVGPMVGPVIDPDASPTRTTGDSWKRT